MVSPTRNHTGFLTNSHVVAPPSSSSEISTIEFDGLGLPYNAAANNPGRTWLAFFAGKDIDATQAHGEEALKGMDALITSKESEEKISDERGRLTAQKKADIQAGKDKIRRMIREMKESLLAVKSMPRLVGRTILASGRALTADHKTLDYAFVEGPRGNTRLPFRATFEAAKALPINLGVKQVLMFPEGSSSSEFSSIEPGQWYFKVGRTTGLTGGLCNGVDTWIKPANNHTLWDAKGQVVHVRRGGKKLHYDKGTNLLKRGKDGKPLETEGDDSFYYASEWVIVNGSIDRLSQNTQEQFCSQGDSGSLIIDREGRVAGILWGEMRGWCGPEKGPWPYIGAGLVTDINDVMAGMKMALGWPEGATVDVLRFL